jgi:hypothetical protein
MFSRPQDRPPPLVVPSHAMAKQLTLEMVRKRVLSDPNTAKIAKELNIPLEDYVTQVVYFVLHPEADPDMLLVEDQDLRAQGHTPPKQSEMLAYLKEAVAVVEASGATGFDDAKKKKVSLDGGPSKKRGTTGTHSNAHLQDELKKQMRKTKKG